MGLVELILSGADVFVMEWRGEHHGGGIEIVSGAGRGDGDGLGSGSPWDGGGVGWGSRANAAHGFASGYGPYKFREPLLIGAVGGGGSGDGCGTGTGSYGFQERPCAPSEWGYGFKWRWPR